MKIIGIIAGLAIILTGCMHISHMAMHPSADTLAVMNQKIVGRSGSVTTRSDDFIYASNVVIGSDSTIWKNCRTKQMQVMPNADIDHVIVRDHKMGLKEGAIKGAYAGAAVGFALGALCFVIDDSRVIHSNPPPSDSTGLHYESVHDYHPPFLQYLAVGALCGAGVGSGLGIFFGGTGGALIQVKFDLPEKKR